MLKPIRQQQRFKRCEETELEKNSSQSASSHRDIRQQPTTKPCITPPAPQRGCSAVPSTKTPSGPPTDAASTPQAGRSQTVAERRQPTILVVISPHFRTQQAISGSWPCAVLCFLPRRGEAGRSN